MYLYSPCVFAGVAVYENTAIVVGITVVAPVACDEVSLAVVVVVLPSLKAFDELWHHLYRLDVYFFER